MIATILLILIHFYVLWINYIKDGEERKTQYDYRVSFFSILLFFVLYYYAGIFDNLQLK